MKRILRQLLILVLPGLLAIDAFAASTPILEDANSQLEANPRTSPADETGGGVSRELVSKSGSGHALRFQSDSAGRLSQISSTRGNTYRLVYSSQFAKEPVAIEVNGVLKSLPLLRSGSKAGGMPGDSDYQDMLNSYLDYLSGYAGCPICVGLTDSLTDFFTYVGGASALGSVIGVCLAEYAGATLAEMGLAGFLGGVAGAAYVAALGAGALFGTWVYDSTGDIIFEWIYDR